jgi:hypothetical protein
MDVDEEPAKADESAAGDKADGKESAEAKEGEGEAKDKPKEKEPSSYTLTAPCRVVPQQVKHVSFPPGESRAPCRSAFQSKGVAARVHTALLLLAVRSKHASRMRSGYLSGKEFLAPEVALLQAVCNWRSSTS